MSEKQNKGSAMQTLLVVITSHNEPEHIARILDRIKTLPDGVEIVVVDDCSDSAEYELTMQAVKSFRERTNAGYMAALDEPGGCGGARNIGAKHAYGDWLWFIDGDDNIAPDGLVKVWMAIQKAKADAIAIGYEIRRAGGETTKVIPPENIKPWEWSITAWSKVIRRSRFLEFQAPFVEDNDWWLRTCLDLDRIDVLPEVCYEYNRQAPGSVTSIFERIWDNAAAVQPLPFHKLVASMGKKAWVVSAMLKMMGRLIDVRLDALARRSPESLVNAIDFAIRYFQRAIKD